jgi:peptidoglycan/LPS O-acetylase OafA/YrhL
VLLWGILGVSYAMAIHSLRLTIDDVSRLTGRAVWYPGAVIVITGIFVIMVAVALGWLNWVRGSWLTTAGALTYPLYLLHEEIGWAVIARLHDRVPKWPLVIGLVVAMLVAAWLVHRLVERPIAPRLREAMKAGLAAMAAEHDTRRPADNDARRPADLVNGARDRAMLVRHRTARTDEVADAEARPRSPAASGEHPH